jgi:hypothetical protein
MSKDLFVYKIDAINHSNRWGNSSVVYRAAEDPEVDITYYSNSAENVVLKVYAIDKEILLYSKKINAKKGLNIYKYDLSMDEKSKKKFESQLKSANSKSYKALKKSDTGKYFLPLGTYKVELVKSKEVSSTVLEIK